VGKANKLLFLRHISLSYGNSKDTKVSNVATGTFRLESATLNAMQMWPRAAFVSSYFFDFDNL
jgi:hypothetical protein